MGKYLIGVPIFVLIFGLIWVWGFGLCVQQTRTFHGSEEFKTYNEAEVYQRMIVEEAQLIDAKVDVSISITSPPVVTYDVVVPNDDEFKYGNRLLDGWEKWFMYCSSTLMCLLALGGCLIKLKENK